MGPTAAGKTAAALALAERFDVSLISVDSAQVYRGLNIGAAKPDPAVLARFPHALIDIRDPEEDYSVAEFLVDCRDHMQRAHAAGRISVLVGGTMMYFRALVYGLDRMPPGDPELRAAIAAESETLGWPALHARLARVDPQAAARIQPRDRQRLQRALELIELTGHGPSHWQQRAQVPQLRSVPLILTPADRATLHRRIDQRVEQMIELGLLEEVETLRRRPGLTMNHGAMKAVGYRQLWRFLDGGCDNRNWPAAIASATRQLAKRQLTALRQWRGGRWYDPGRDDTMDRLCRQLDEFWRQFRLD